MEDISSHDLSFVEQVLPEKEHFFESSKLPPEYI